VFPTGDHDASVAPRLGTVESVAPPCEVRVLGAVEVLVGGVAVDLGPPKQRALLVLLLLHAGEAVATDELVDQLWGGAAPRTALHSIQIYVSDLRKSFGRVTGGPIIDTHAPGYRLRIPRESIDIVRFERLVDAARSAARRGHTGDAIDLFRSAMALWRGKPFSEFAYEEFAQPHIRRTTALHRDALEQLATAELDVGEVHAAAEHAELLAVADPLRERAIELRMLALYQSGRHVEALRTYQSYRTYLADEVGAVPSPPLQRLNERVLVHDPSLLPTEHSPTSIREATRNPYKGLRPFGERDAPDFFGRDELIRRMVEDLAAGRRLLALVGPSGCGKSSVVAAGLVPALRAGALPGSAEWRYASVVPGDHPVQQVEAAIARAGGGRGGPSAAAPYSPIESTPTLVPEAEHVLLVIDQFEELFRIPDEGTRRRFLDRLAETLSDPDDRLTVVLSLRADHYDRPLMHPAFADVFTQGVINVLPMTAAELSAAVRQPAALVGVEVQPELVAAAVSEVVTQPSSLPLLQYALTEQFEVSRGGVLSLDDYIDLGGLRAVLTQRAEEVFSSLEPPHQRAAMQVLLRMIRVGNGTGDTCHRVSVSELARLDLDPVVLSDVLDLFGRHRLVSFDADPMSNAPTVGVAHEALLTHWPRLADSVDRHRVALRRHEGLRAAANDWEDSGRDADYLLAGGRLAEAEGWRTGGALALTDSERDLIDASLEHREADISATTARAVVERRRRRTRRGRLVAVVAGGSLVLAALAVIANAGGGDRVERVGLFYFSSGEVGDIIQAGFDRAVSEFGFASYKTDPDLDDSETNTPEQALDEMATGREMVVTFAIGTDVDAVAADHPDTRFVVFDQPTVAANVTSITFASHEASYLAGAAAALRSRTGTIGFIGGVDMDVIWGFEAGFVEGARAVRPDIEIVTTFLASPPDFGAGFLEPQRGERAARTMYGAGADVIFAAAGTSGLGVFEAAVDMSTPGNHLWAIGVDSDQYSTVGSLPGSVGAEQWVDHILTSVVKRYDTVIYDTLAAFEEGRDLTGSRELGFADGAVDLAFSGGFIDDLRPVLDELRDGIVSGRIDVPCRTPDHPDPPPGTSSVCGGR
jgi:basic membrane lipoprotein Med (substrate-binding protein (PBP1-ABC) superfamily)/DNA-binding SARP family transcriptional activator